jgi:hypothetical protein
MSPEQRLVHLEGRCRLLTRALFVIVVTGVFAVLVGAKGIDAPQRLRVSALEVVDAKGNVRVLLGDLAKIKEEGELYGARIVDADGKTTIDIIDVGQWNIIRGKNLVASLKTYESGASFQLRCPGGKQSAAIYTANYPDGDAAGIQLRDAKEEVRFMQETNRVKRVASTAADPTDPFAPKK